MRTRQLGTAALVLLLGLLLAACAPAEERLPATFPSSVPVVSGRVLAADHDRYEWHVWVAAAQPAAAYRRARARLLAAGYSETADAESSAGSDGQFCDPTWCVGLTGFHDPQHGDSVRYVVARTSGLGPPLPL